MADLTDLSRAHPELSAHRRRVTELCRRVGADHITKELLWMCRDFDEAVEFAGYEGSSIPAAIYTFLEESAVLFEARSLGALRAIVLPRERLGLTGYLPVLPSAANRLMRTSATDASVADLEKIASSDPVLAGRLLGAANSAIFGRGSEIGSLHQAVLRLGIPMSRKTLLAACFGTLFASSALNEIWRHSRTVAALAYEMAASCGMDPETAWLAGLLHDAGRLITHLSPACKQEDVLRLIAAGFPLVYAETLVFGVDHAELGGGLLTTWHVPREIAEAVAFHHRPEASESELSGILALAEEESCESGLSESLSPSLRRAAAARLCGLTGGLRETVRNHELTLAMAV
jgi:putative nucleotidyltransferase with HDIG domain